MSKFAWTTDPVEAEKEQTSIREMVDVSERLWSSSDFDQGIAIGTSYDENTRFAFAIGVYFDNSGWCEQEEVEEYGEVTFPYIPGLLAFRVGPVVCSLLEKIRNNVNVVLLDGQGIAHPRGLGLASHIGVLYDLPTIGVTRNRLFGDVVEPPRGFGNSSEVRHPHTRALIGYALSLGKQCDTCFVSPGHRIEAGEALRFVRKISGKRTCFPRPLQRAHAIANRHAKRFWRTSEQITTV